MTTKPFDSFHDSLICQYRELIHEAIIESEIDHKSNLDLNIFITKFQSVMRAALLDGISESEMLALVEEAQRFQKMPLKVG